MAITKPFAVIPHPLGTVASGNELASRPALHLGEFKDPGMVWQSSGASSLWVRGDFGSNKAVDFMAMLSANALAGTQIRLRLGASQAEVDSGGNVIAQPNDMGDASWLKSGTGAATGNAAVAPDGSNTASQVSGIGAGTGAVRTTAALTSAAPDVHVWIKRISTSGVLSINSPLSYPDGEWQVNMASLSAGWELLTPTHPAVTVVNAFKSTGASIGMRFEATSGGPLSFYAWDAFISGTAIAYDSGTLPFISPSITREDGKYGSHLEMPSAATARWWRVDITGHTGDFQAMALVLGKRASFGTFYNDKGFEFGQEDMGSVGIGRFGVVEEETGIKLRTLAMDFGWLSDSDRHDIFQPLRDKLGTTGTALWCFDPDATVQRQDKTYFGWLRKPAMFRAASFRHDRWQSQFDIRSII